MRKIWLLTTLALTGVVPLHFGTLTYAAIPSGVIAKKASLTERLETVRNQVMEIEKSLITSLRTKQEAQANIQRIQKLISLQRQEKELIHLRANELESTVRELESRRAVLHERIQIEQLAVRKALKDLKKIQDPIPGGPKDIDHEKIDQPKSKMVRNMIQMGLREIEALRVDLEDANRLENRIGDEKAQLDVSLNELAESESVLELNKQIQFDLIKKNHYEHVVQLESYRKLKTSESQVSNMIKTFNARMELQEASRAERAASRAMLAMAYSDFSKAKGTLPFPVLGRIVGRFGKAFDPESKLQIFKKGIEIAAESGSSVKAVYSGKVAYSGELANYGRVAIIDHGDHFYTLCARLGKLSKNAGDEVKVGDSIGMSETSGKPVYFEIRAKNIPVDPLAWVAKNN